MSDQPITGVPPSAAAAPDKVPGRGGIWFGIALLVIGIGGAVATVLLQQASYSGTVENLVRALPGYRSELLFEKTGTFTFYYEYAGTFTTTLDGAPQTITLDAPPTPPEIDARLFDQNGDELRLRGGVDDVSYDVSGFKGVAISQVDIEQEGPYTLEVVSDSDASFALSAGEGTVSKPSTVLPVVIAVLGLLLGLVTILVSTSRRARARREAAEATAIPATATGPRPFPSPGTVVSPTATSPPWAQEPTAATSPPPVWATAPQQDVSPPATAPPSAWAAPGTGGAPPPDAPTAPVPVTAPMPVQPPPAAPAAPPAFPPPGQATQPPGTPPAADEDEQAQAPPASPPWGAPAPPSS